MAGKRYKATSALQNRRPERMVGRDVQLVRDTSRPVPIPPAGLRKVAKDAWLAFWRSPMASLVQDDSDMDALRDWAYCVSERDRLRPQFKRQPLVLGSQGQLVRNPIGAIINDYTRQIDRYREQFGMTPLSRMRLGIAVGEAHDVLSELTASLGSDDVEVVDLGTFDGGGNVIEVLA